MNLLSRPAQASPHYGLLDCSTAQDGSNGMTPAGTNQKEELRMPLDRMIEPRLSHPSIVSEGAS